jgi:hypothetical protein
MSSGTIVVRADDQADRESRGRKMATSAAKKPGGRSSERETDSEAQALVQMFRVLTEEQFDFWITALNRAAAAMDVDADAFTRDDRQKTISYWYLLMFLLELYAARRDPFEVRKGETWLSEGLVSMKQLSRNFKGRYREETIRRYVFDLKGHGLIALDGRGSEANVHITAPAILALTDTIRQWVTTFREVDRRVQKMGTI